MLDVRIGVVGSYATGLTMKVVRLPSAGETILGSGYRVDFGGKGSNQALGCARLGAKTSFVAKIGKDGFAEMALELYREEGLDVRWVKQTSEAPTGIGFILVEEGSGRNCIALDPGANEILTPADIMDCKEAFDTCGVILTQLEIPVMTAEAALARGRSVGAITILNPAPVRPLPPALFALIDVLTPNETEAKVLCGCSPDAAISPEQIGRELVRKGVRQVVMTLGENGALIVTSSSMTNIPAHRMKVVDTTGAGDAFNAGLAVALASGENLEAAVRFGAVAGGLAVTREGVVPSLPNREEVTRFCEQERMAVPKWLAD
ncbi:MAG: ribokinase [Candidatus Acidiferrales bacterium]